MQPFIINRRTDFSHIRLIDENMNFHDKVFIGDARTKANEVGLSLVCFNLPDKNNLALCKIIDYGKWKYQQEKSHKKEQLIHKNVVKEIRFSPVISDNDVEHKLHQVLGFLKDGDDVILSMRFKGIHKRLMSIGKDKMNEIVKMCDKYGEEVSRKCAGFQIMVRLKPAKTTKKQEEA